MPKLTAPWPLFCNPLRWATALGLFVCIGYASGQGKPNTGPGPQGGERPTTVRLGPVVARDMRSIIPAIGTATPAASVVLRPQVDGVLMAVHAKEGQAVRKGQLLAELDPRPFAAALQQAQGQLLREQALLDNARADLARYQTLLAQDSIAKQQVDTQAALVRQYQGNVLAQQGAVKAAKLQLEHTRITAPMAGRLGLRTVDVGNRVQSSDPAGLSTLVQTNPMLVAFSVAEPQWPQVQAALRARGKAAKGLAVEAWDRSQTQRLATGTLAYTDNQIDPATGTIKLKARFNNPDEILFPNQFVNVRLVLAVRQAVPAVPTSAIVTSSQGPLVYKKMPNQTVQSVPVRLGLSDGQYTEVLLDAGSKLAMGDSVVLEGTDRLRDGSKISEPSQNRK